MTQLQRRVSKSRIRRRLAREFLAMNELPANGFRRMANGMFSECLAEMPDPQIKRMLYEILQCIDITPAERAEAMQLLQSADTALTAAQLDYLLSE